MATVAWDSTGQPASGQDVTMAVFAPTRPQCGKHVLRLLR